MDTLYLRFEKKDCMGCHACEVACKQEHDLGVGPRLIRVEENFSDYNPIYCRQCAKAPCIESCPEGAISRSEEGIVLIDNDNCIGCRECVSACPFGAMQFEDARGFAVKCDMCPDRRSVGKQPACASICPTGCIQIGGREKSIAAVFEKRV